MVGDDALISNLALNAISLTAPSDMWRTAWKKPGNAVHCVIFQKADASSAGYSRSGFQCTHPTSAVLSDAWYFAKHVTLSLALRSSGDAGRGFGRVGAAAALVAR